MILLLLTDITNLIHETNSVTEKNMYCTYYNTYVEVIK